MNEVFQRIAEVGIVPVIAINDADKAVPLAKALVAGGVPIAEITFRTEQAEDAIRRIAVEVPNILLGAGTVTNIEQVKRAVDAGAKFLVSPGFNPRVAAYCAENKIPFAPGCANPSDIEGAMELGYNVVKFFPAEQAGGLDYIKAVSAPYPQVMFLPTGGINASNAAKYLAFSHVIACGGSWMATSDLIRAGEFETIERLCREAVAIVRSARQKT